MKPNYNKLIFGRTIEDNPMAGDCHNYGVVSGCDIRCHVLLSGKCKEPQEMAVSPGRFDKDDIEYIKELYKL